MKSSKDFQEVMETRKKEANMHIVDEVRKEVSMEKDKMGLDCWLQNNFPSAKLRNWKEIRLFLSSTFVDTQAERDGLIKRVIPSINRQLARRWIRVVPVDLRWGVSAEESKDCEAIQKTCLTQVDKCRQVTDECPWFLCLRTERYGWIQDRLLSSKDSEIPQKYKWLDKFGAYGKHVSITSLECMHASLPTKRLNNSPNVFIYKRHITNPDNIEPDMRWIFDFEYVPKDTELEPDVEHQYTKTPQAEAYYDDKEKLDAYLESLIHVKYSTYECQYEKGGARITQKNKNKKSFGVGYVQGLSKFEKQVESDLLQAITNNFPDASALDVPQHVFDTVQHEDAVIAKAYTFVGRAILYKTIMDHCTSREVGRNVMIIHGEPGCGKSGLLAAASQQCLNEIRKKEGFVFVHFVNSCPDSNVLEFMLRRLQLNLKEYRESFGDTSISEETPKSAGDLKQKHLQFLFESANKFPDKMFIILIDAVNQFHQSLSAWKMWWLPSKDVPNNLRFVITTLDKANGTFENACQVCPNAAKLEVTSMSYEDRREMISETLERFNKKLTVDQLNILVSKSESPLYLIAATEAVRKFGVYEQVTEYIKGLPNSIPGLFNFLLDEWSSDHGEDFVKDVTGLICLSKDGLLENQINDILNYREEREGKFCYYSSFSRVYDSLCSFLSSGGGGYLSFFHDQLKFEIRRKYLTRKEIEYELHTWLVNFFFSCIASQLCDRPNSGNQPAYYRHCLQQIVYHQLELPSSKEGLRDFKSSLRNIYFVRERVQHEQQHSLQHEYLNAIEKSSDANEIKALRQWAEFAQVYSPYIAQFPDWSHNMAVNQAQTSFVALDTSKLPVPESCGDYPLYWNNKPNGTPLTNDANNSRENDSITTRYQKSDKAEVYISCVASAPERNLCCFGAKAKKAFVYEQNTGVLIHEVNVEGYAWSVYLSTRHDTLWIGHSEGFISIWNVNSGTEEWREEILIKKEVDTEDEDDEEDEDDDEETGGVTWIKEVGEYVACGTSEKYGDDGAIGTIAIVDEEKKKVIRRWSTEIECYSYCFHAYMKLIFSGHQGMIKGWTITGQPVINCAIDGKVKSLSPHPNEEVVVCVVEEKRKKYCMKQMNVSTRKTISSTPGTGSIALYDCTGRKIICTSADRKTIGTYGADEECLLENECREHTGDINAISLVPGKDLVLTAARDGSKMFAMPISYTHVLEQCHRDVIHWCDFFPDGKEFATLADNGRLSVWLTSCCEPYISVDIEGGKNAAIHPDGNFICVCTTKTLHWRRISNLEEVNTFNVPSGSQEGDDNNELCINDVKISSDGIKCVLATKSHGTIVLDIEDIDNISVRLTYASKGEVFTCDIHSDCVQVASGIRDHVDVWNMMTNETICKLHDIGWPQTVRFVPGSSQLLYTDGRYVRIVDLSEGCTMAFDTEVEWDAVVSLLGKGNQLMTSKNRLLRLHDVISREQKYTFVDPDQQSDQFTCLAAHQSHNVIIAGNKTGMFYILKTERNCQSN